MFSIPRLAVAGAIALLWTTPSPADWTDARCGIYAKGSDYTD